MCAIRQTIYRARRNILPPLPKSEDEVFDVLQTLEPKTNRGENFVHVVDRQKHIIIFTCDTNLKFVCDSPTIYMDGTFQFCTKFFSQLFTIHGFRNNHYLPLVFCVLGNKTTEAYKNVFYLIKEACNSKDLLWNPQNVMIDFEKAIHRALEEVLPQSHVIGCRFHLTQSWWRKIQNLGLVCEYKNRDSEIGKWLKLTFGMIFLQPDEVGDFSPWN